MKGKSCAFTGHRPEKLPWKYNEADRRCIDLKAALFAQIRKLTDEGVTQFLSGMALGVDLWSAQAVLALRQGNPKQKLHCILPCMAQADAWSESARKQYHWILTQADSVIYVNREYHRNCMLERNHFMVDHAEVLLAVCSDVILSISVDTSHARILAAKRRLPCDPGNTFLF